MKFVACFLFLVSVLRSKNEYFVIWSRNNDTVGQLATPKPKQGKRMDCVQPLPPRLKADVADAVLRRVRGSDSS